MSGFEPRVRTIKYQLSHPSPYHGMARTWVQHSQMYFRFIEKRRWRDLHRSQRWCLMNYPLTKSKGYGEWGGGGAETLIPKVNWNRLESTCLTEKRKTKEQCCRSGMFIPDPGSWFSSIPDTASKNSDKEKGEKKFVILLFFCSHKYHKIKNYFFLAGEEKGPIYKEL